MLWSCELHGFKDCLTDDFQDLKMQEITGLEDECILDCDKPCDLTDSLNFTSSKKWDSIRGKCLLWAGLDKFTTVWICGLEEWPDQSLHARIMLHYTVQQASSYTSRKKKTENKWMQWTI